MAGTPDVGDALSLSFQLPGSLVSLADAQSPLSSAVRGAVQQSVKALLEHFGIPAEPTITISARGTDVAAGGKVVRLTVDGRLTRYPDELLQHAYCYVNGQLLDPEATPASIHAWLKENCERAPDTDSGRRVVAFLRLTCVKILEREPAVLLGLPQARSYAAALVGAPDADAEWLLSILRQVLDLRISLARRQVVADVLAKTPREGNAATAIVEELITALRRDTVDIQIDKPSLRELTTTWAADGPAMFPFLRDGLFEELGLPFPKLRFVVVDDVQPGSFAFRVNDLVSLPLFGLGPGQLMVNDTAERLRPSAFEAVPTANPATGQPNAIIEAASDQRAQQQGLTTWNQIGYLILCLAEFLRQNGWCTVHRGGVLRQLQQLDGAFPALLRMVRSRRTDDEITRLLRALVRDRVSVQNLRAILESLLDDNLAGEARTENEPSGLANLVAFVRIALGRAIAHKAARNTNTVVVYLVDPAIERVIAEPAAELEEHGDGILRALRTELAYLPPTAQVPSLLTSIESRAHLQRLVSAEYPRMSVIAHEELPPGTNVQPVARVGL